MQLLLELEVLNTSNTLTKIQSFIGGEGHVYQLTHLGVAASKYLDGI
jgi:hypothetical protein